MDSIHNQDDIKDDIKDSPYKRSPSLKKAQNKYYIKNKSKLVADQIAYNKTYLKRDFICECGEKLHIAGKWLHLRSKKHSTRMNNIKNGRPADYKTGNLKYNCDCGSVCLVKNRTIHNKSKKHLRHQAEVVRDMHFKFNPMIENPMDFNPDLVDNIMMDINYF